MPTEDEIICALATCALATMDEAFAYKKGFTSRGDAIRAFDMLATPVNILILFDRYKELQRAH